MKRNELGRLCLALGFIGGMFMQVEAKKNTESGAKSAKAQKLELTWVGKDQKIAVEPRILLEVPEKSNLPPLASRVSRLTTVAAAGKGEGEGEGERHETRDARNGDARQETRDAGCDNLLIHGDNLLALKSLEQKYAGKIRCIYIDPPYNTGSAFEHYDDNLEHSQWLNLMRPRLEILWKLLAPDGSIWISIDDREGAYLRVMCDELFGRCNFVSNISWQRTYSTRNDSKGIVNEVEHILVYSREEGWQPNLLPRTAEMDDKYKNPDHDVEAWKSTDALAPDSVAHQGMVYAIQNPFTGKLIYPTPGRHWACDQDAIKEHLCGWAEYELRDIDDAKERAAICGIGIDEVRKGVKAIVLTKSLDESKKSAEAVLARGQWPKYYFMKQGKGGLARKTYISSVGGVAPSNLFEYKDVGHTDEAKKEILKVFDGKAPFATPKPERLILRILTIASNPGDLVLDSFLGSGTTCAVAHKMGRKWIGIEMGDHAYTHCKVRMDKVIAGTDEGGVTKQTGWTKGGGYRFYELAPSLVKFDTFGEAVINAQYNADMLAAGMALQEGFIYEPDEKIYWKQAHAKGSTTSWLYTTTRHVGRDYLASIAGELKGGEFLEIACTSFDAKAAKDYPRITMRKIPESILKRCEFDRDSYALNIVNAPEEGEE